MAATVDRVMMVSVAGWGKEGQGFALTQPQVSRTGGYTGTHNHNPLITVNYDNYAELAMHSRKANQTTAFCQIGVLVKNKDLRSAFWGQGGVFHTIYVVGNNICSVSAEFFTFPFCV